MIELAYTMHRGASRVQQDALLVSGLVVQARNLLPKVATLEGDGLFAIADGVAVSPGASRASRTVLESLPELVCGDIHDSPDGLLASRHARLAQHRLCDAMDNGQVPYGASCTLVAVHIRANRLATVNVGDSRTFLVRGTRATQLSRDHTQLQSMRESGELDDNTEYASIYDSLSDCLMADPEADAFEVHRATLTLEAGDRIALSSDGVHDVLGEAGWHELLVRYDEPLALVQAAREAVFERLAPDNFSLIALRFP